MPRSEAPIRTKNDKTFSVQSSKTDERLNLPKGGVVALLLVLTQGVSENGKPLSSLGLEVARILVGDEVVQLLSDLVEATLIGVSLDPRHQSLDETIENSSGPGRWFRRMGQLAR